MRPHKRSILVRIPVAVCACMPIVVCVASTRVCSCLLALQNVFLCPCVGALPLQNICLCACMGALTLQNVSLCASLGIDPVRNGPLSSQRVMEDFMLTKDISAKRIEISVGVRRARKLWKFENLKISSTPNVVQVRCLADIRYRAVLRVLDILAVFILTDLFSRMWNILAVFLLLHSTIDTALD